MQNILTTFLIGLSAIFGAVLPAAQQAPTANVPQSFGATYQPARGQTYTLQASIGRTNTTIPLSSFKEPISNIPFTMSYLGTSIAYGTLDPQQPGRAELISFTGITQNANGTALLTGVTRGLGNVYPFTASTTLAQTHSGQSYFILSDAPQVFAQYPGKLNTETISGLWTFSSTSVPKLDQNPNFDPLASTTFATIGYVASTSFAGTVNASETQKGIVELSTSAEAAAGTSLGSTGARLTLPGSLATSTCQTVTASVVIASTTTGKIDQNCIDQTARYNFTGATGSLSPVGSITAYASVTPPTGWLLADGSSVLRATYPNLFAIIGTTYGAADGTHFNLPDVRGRNILMASTTANIAQTGGESNHTQSSSELAAHTHTTSAFTASGAGGNTPAWSSSNSAGITSVTSSVTGSSTPSNVLDPFIVLEYIIKY